MPDMTKTVCAKSKEGLCVSKVQAVADKAESHRGHLQPEREEAPGNCSTPLAKWLLVVKESHT